MLDTAWQVVKTTSSKRDPEGLPRVHKAERGLIKMKFNFKKIASVLTSTVMLSSTLALAAAANFPAPFVSGGNSDVAIVYGSSPLAQDQVAVLDINTALTNSIASQPNTGTTTISGNDVVELDRPSSKLHLGQGINDVFARSITSSDMKTLLADGIFTSYGDNKDHDYTQKIDIANLTYQQFDDNDYAQDAPTLGIRIPSTSGSNWIANYTLTFTDQPTFDDTLKNSELVMMGKKYFIVDVTNSTSTPSITLLDSANTQTINEGETKSVQIGSKTYDVTVSDVSSTDRVKITVNGKTSSSLSIGATYKVEDGVYIGVKDVSYKVKDSATSNAELTFGLGKLELTDGSSVKLNDNAITDNNNDDVVAHLVNTTTTLTKIVLEWKASNDRFITENSSIVIPGFNSIKLSTTGMVFPDMEDTVLENDGKYTMQLQAPIKDGDVTLGLISNNVSSANFTTIGKDYNTQLRTSGVGTLTFNGTTDENFIASWASGQDAESYELYATSFNTENGVNKTTVKERVGDFEQTVQQGDSISLGNVQLTVGAINKNDKSVNFTAGSGVSFHHLYTKDGLKIYLPYDSTQGGAGAGPINVTGPVGNSSSYNLVFQTEDKDGNIGAGNNVTLTIGTTSKGYVTVSNVAFSPGGSSMSEIGNSNVFVGYGYSPLATKVTWDQGPDQETATLTYHGGESYAKVFVTDISATVSTPGQTGSLSVSDSEVSTVSGKNLIVVGGSCINTVAASLLGSSSPLCGSDWEQKTGVGVGSFLIQTFTSPYSSSKIATLVAGYNQPDTENAAKYLTTQAVDVSKAGTKLTGSTATTATLVTS